MSMVSATGRFDRAEIIQRAKEIYVAGETWAIAMRKAYADALAQRELDTSGAAEQREMMHRIRKRTNV